MEDEECRQRTHRTHAAFQETAEKLKVPIKQVRSMRLALDINEDEMDPRNLVSPCYSGGECNYETFAYHTDPCWDLYWEIEQEKPLYWDRQQNPEDLWQDPDEHSG